ncbi:helix-turn-helix transcriptional regulator [Lachnospiraceae bacterium LCP25S3_G4]
MYYDIEKSGKRIKYLKERKGLKQEMVSADLGISLDGFKRIKWGSNCARIDTLVIVTKIGRR